MAKHYKSYTHEELVAEIKELKATINRKDRAFERIEDFARAGNARACKQAAGNQLNRGNSKPAITDKDDILRFIDKRVDKDILAKTSALKVDKLSGGMAYAYTQTPTAKQNRTTLRAAKKVIAEKLSRLHAEVRVKQRRR